MYRVPFENRRVTILIIICDSQWNGGWPIQLTSNSPRQEIDSPALDTDQPHIQNLHGRTYMAAVSPWFFTVRDQLISNEILWASFSFALSALWAKVMEQECTSVPSFLLTLHCILFSGFIAEMTGFLYGDGNACSPSEVP
jgi:hypothetical protein